jgi:hypothetical protein
MAEETDDSCPPAPTTCTGTKLAVREEEMEVTGRLAETRQGVAVCVRAQLEMAEERDDSCGRRQAGEKQ